MKHNKRAYLILALLPVLRLASASSSCSFPAIFNFGDSNSDTGAYSAAFREITPPYGETFFKKPSGRLCDGRLIIDLIAEKVGLPYLGAYLDSVGADFRHGANFATSGSSILPGGYSPFDLSFQLAQFIQFKSRTTAIHKNQNYSETISPSKSKVPKLDDFSKALYTFDIGQNDITSKIVNGTSDDQIRATFPKLMNQFTQTVAALYKEGARTFWVHNTGPAGCLPYIAIPVVRSNGSLDQYGCIKPLNDLAQEFNQYLKDSITQLRRVFTLATFTYVDVYSVKFGLIANAVSLGFHEPLKFCCGSYDPIRIFCGTAIEFNGTTYHGSSCEDPSTRISWDSMHNTEAANLWIGAGILNGSFSDPPVSLFSCSVAHCCYSFQSACKAGNLSDEAGTTPISNRCFSAQ